MTLNNSSVADEWLPKIYTAGNECETSASINKIISRLYQFSILTEEDWLEFKLLFDRIHPGFISRLRLQFPGMTAGEQRQVLFIKLNMSTRECARMLGISVESVIKSRYRLKKKFNLPEKENLDDYVKCF